MTEAVKKNGLNYGIIVGVASIIIAVLIYVIDLTAFSNWMIGLLMLAVNTILGIMAVSKAKSALGGYISFKEAFTTFFLALLIGSILYILFMYILWNFIDPEGANAVVEATIEKTVEWMQAAGTPAGDIKEMVEQMRASDNFGLVGQLKALAGSVIIYSIIGLIVAAAMKKNKPEFE